MLIEQTLDRKTDDKQTCECGVRLPFTPSPYITTEKRVCPQCGRVHWVDDRPIDWVRVSKGGEE